MPLHAQQLNDSSVIISTLTSYLLSDEKNLLKTVKCYPTVEYNDDDGKKEERVEQKLVRLG